MLVARQKRGHDHEHTQAKVMGKGGIRGEHWGEQVMFREQQRGLRLITNLPNSFL